MVRVLADMATLDTRLQEELAKIAPCSDFQLTVWQQKPDKSGCNWNAHFKRIRNEASQDTRWWDVVPKLRATTNLDD